MQFQTNLTPVDSSHMNYIRNVNAMQKTQCNAETRINPKTQCNAETRINSKHTVMQKLRINPKTQCNAETRINPKHTVMQKQN